MDDQERLCNFVQHLEENNIQDYVELPQITVMGDTSSGKSSLLSALSGIAFPSANGMCTRCPTRLRMERSTEDFKTSVGIRWHSTSDYADERKFPLEMHTDGDQITDAIKRAQQCIIDLSKKGVARDIIEITVCSKENVNVTLVDLPGIMKFDVEKDKGSTLIKDIDDLLEIFLNNERCIILAVIPANVHFSNTEIMARAKKVDPSTKRIIPVITKPDLIDPGAEEEVKKLLLGQMTDDFKLGFNMVKCRGQKDLNEAKSLSDSVKLEMEFFETREPWKSVAKRSFFGTTSLKNKLAAIQVRMLRDTLPAILKEIATKKDAFSKELEELGLDLSQSGVRRAVFMKLTSKFSKLVRETTEGRLVKNC
jgi:GTP-binding protein EngB required for normal cell division